MATERTKFIKEDQRVHGTVSESGWFSCLLGTFCLLVLTENIKLDLRVFPLPLIEAGSREAEVYETVCV